MSGKRALTIDNDQKILIRKCSKSLCAHLQNDPNRKPKIPFSRKCYEFFGFKNETKPICLKFENNYENQNLTPQNKISEKSKIMECQLNGVSNIGNYLFEKVPEGEEDNFYIVFIKVEKPDTYEVQIINNPNGIDEVLNNVIELYNNKYAQEYGKLECADIQVLDADILYEMDIPLLRDLSKLREEAKIKIQKTQSEQYRDIVLNPEFRNIYADYVSKSGEKVEFLTHTTKLTTKDNQFVYIPNIWFLLGIDMFDFYQELGNYKKYYIEIEKARGLTNQKKRDTYASQLYETYDNNTHGWNEIKTEFMKNALAVFAENIPNNTEQTQYYAEMLWKFASNGYQSWIGKGITEPDDAEGEETERKNTRKVSRKDFRDSVVLALLDLVAADQGYVPDIMTAYETDERFQKYLENKQLITAFWQIDKKNHKCSLGGDNLVVYGTPGCGKSTYVENECQKYISPNNNSPNNIIRTTFYQDYTYTDFVGQILPEIHSDGAVLYSFNPGPFTQALELALVHPDMKIALVIEELNRGNAASIFGDIFQLLDRYEDNDRKGEGKFTIHNRNIQDYLKTKNLELDEIWIPANLSIYATMNTSDQNVFTLDTAFKRRWRFYKLPNKFPKESDKEKHPFAEKDIAGMPGISWQNFVESLNDYIVDCNDLFKSEDKLLGIYFVNEETLLNKERFPPKVFEYLWDDVFRNNHEYLFDATIKTLDELLDRYRSEDGGINVFCDDFKKILIKKKKPETNDKEMGIFPTPTQHDSE